MATQEGGGALPVPQGTPGVVSGNRPRQTTSGSSGSSGADQASAFAGDDDEPDTLEERFGSGPESDNEFWWQDAVVEKMIDDIKAVASQYADKGIRCNAILPGLMHTPMIDFLAEQYARDARDHNAAYDKMIAIRNKASPTGKMGTGWDTANAALFLASDEAAYVNGHLLVVDGGITLRA